MNEFNIPLIFLEIKLVQIQRGKQFIVQYWQLCNFANVDTRFKELLWSIFTSAKTPIELFYKQRFFPSPYSV